MHDCRHDVGCAVGAQPENLCDSEGPTLARHNLELACTVLGHNHSPVLAVAIVANLVHIDYLIVANIFLNISCVSDVAVAVVCNAC